MNIYSVQSQSLIDFIIFYANRKCCLTITKTLKRCRNSSSDSAAKKITVIYFVRCLSGCFQQKKNKKKPGVFNCLATNKENKRTSKK